MVSRLSSIAKTVNRSEGSHGSLLGGVPAVFDCQNREQERGESREPLWVVSRLIVPVKITGAMAYDLTGPLLPCATRCSV